MRLSSSERQEQIIQPALFRHFGSRDEILIAVLDDVRASLASEALVHFDARADPALTTNQAEART